VESIRRLTPPQLLLGAAALIVIGLLFAYLDLGGNDDDSDVAGFVIVSLVAIAISAFLVLWLVPARGGSGWGRPASPQLAHPRHPGLPHADRVLDRVAVRARSSGAVPGRGRPGPGAGGVQARDVGRGYS
jgi:hypothetical protein